MPVADLQSQFLRLSDRQSLETLFADLCGKKKVCRKESKVGLVGHEIKLKAGERELAEGIERVFKDAGFAPPLEEEVRKEVGADEETFKNLTSALTEQGRLVRLSDRVTYHSDPFQAARQIVMEHIQTSGGVTVAELRDRLGVSRKYALALLEYFDNIGLTRREGDRHVLR